MRLWIALLSLLLIGGVYAFNETSVLDNAFINPHALECYVNCPCIQGWCNNTCCCYGEYNENNGSYENCCENAFRCMCRCGWQNCHCH